MHAYGVMGIHEVGIWKHKKFYIAWIVCFKVFLIKMAPEIMLECFNSTLNI